MNYLAQDTIEEALQDLADELQVPRSRYESAERSYRSLADWLHRPASKVADLDPDVYVQGSFRLGTAIKPDEEDYDIDMVCSVSLEKSDISQRDLKKLVGDEIIAYAKSKGMARPQNGTRCWTLHYADDANFHMDTLPAIPDYEKRRQLFEAGPAYVEYKDTAIAITDKNHSHFREICHDWLSSNPKAYAEWFKMRMGQQFRERAVTEAQRMRASVEDVPAFRVRTPLQAAIQFLKRHRDMMFVDRSDEKPISIIITTLSSHAYDQEPTISGALFSILGDMERFIEMRSGVHWIGNPTDPSENFADKWEKHPKRREAFFEWLRAARKDFSTAARQASRDDADAILGERLGTGLVGRARGRREPHRRSNSAVALLEAARTFLTPPHMRRPRWPAAPEGSVRIRAATFERRGFRKTEFGSGDGPLPKNATLWFNAGTNVTGNYKVYWQVVNTGDQAAEADALRGGFKLSNAVRGGLSHKESTLYRGTHSIECFIVKNGKLAARSGQFIVNIS